MHQNDNMIYIIFILPEGKEGILPCQVVDRSHEYCWISAKPQQQRVIKPQKSIDVFVKNPWAGQHINCKWQEKWNPTLCVSCEKDCDHW